MARDQKIPSFDTVAMVLIRLSLFSSCESGENVKKCFRSTLKLYFCEYIIKPHEISEIVEDPKLFPKLTRSQPILSILHDMKTYVRHLGEQKEICCNWMHWISAFVCAVGSKQNEQRLNWTAWRAMNTRTCVEILKDNIQTELARVVWFGEYN